MSVKTPRNQNLTIPNLLSVIRIIIVPFFAYYFLKDDILIATILIILSGLSDAVDGFIARKFNQITELGKILDPFADKITQGTVAICLCIKFPVICPILILFIVKELVMLVMASFLINKNKKPCAAKWYGKVSTVLFYVAVIVIVAMSLFDMDVNNKFTFDLVSYILLTLTGIMMVYSAIKYFGIFKELLSSQEPEHHIDITMEIKAKINENK